MLFGRTAAFCRSFMTHAKKDTAIFDLLTSTSPSNFPQPQLRGSCQCVGSLVSYKSLFLIFVSPILNSVENDSVSDFSELRPEVARAVLCCAHHSRERKVGHPPGGDDLWLWALDETQSRAIRRPVSRLPGSWNTILFLFPSLERYFNAFRSGADGAFRPCFRLSGEDLLQGAGPAA